MSQFVYYDFWDEPLQEGVGNTKELGGCNEHRKAFNNSLRVTIKKVIAPGIVYEKQYFAPELERQRKKNEKTSSSDGENDEC